jgi:hypothetical protein
MKHFIYVLFQAYNYNIFKYKMLSTRSTMLLSHYINILYPLHTFKNVALKDINLKELNTALTQELVNLSLLKKTNKENKDFSHYVVSFNIKEIQKITKEIQKIIDQA